MAAPNIKDLATSVVQVAPVPASTGTTLSVVTSQGARLPTAPFIATLVPDGQLPTLDNAEMVTVTAKSGDALTIQRSYGSTTAKNVARGWRLFAGPVTAHVIGAYDYTDAQIAANATPLATFTTSGKVKQQNYNVRDYGAVGDGTTDDTATINAALAAVTDGGVVVFPKGNYIVGSGPLRVKSNTTILAHGAKITMPPGVKTNIIQNYQLQSNVKILDLVTNGTTTVTSATAGFISGQVGSKIRVYKSTGEYIDTTIASRTNSTTIVLADSISWSETGVYSCIGERDTNIKIFGGTWFRDTNNFNGATPNWNSNSLCFRHVDNLEIAIDSIETRNGKYAINFGDCEHVRVHDVYSPLTNSDFIHLNGPLNDVSICNVSTAGSGDDIIALTGGDWRVSLTMTDTYGSIRNVVIDSVYTDVSVDGTTFEPHTGTDGSRGVLICGGQSVTNVPFTCDNIFISNFRGRLGNSPVQIIEDNSDIGTTGGGVGRVYMKDCVNISGTNSNSGHFVLMGGITIDTVVVDNCHNIGASADVWVPDATVTNLWTSLIKRDRVSIGGSGTVTNLQTILGAADFTNFPNSIQIKGDDTFIGVDTNTLPRIGFMKKSGSQPKFGYANDTDFIFAISDTNSINPTANYSDVMILDTSKNLRLNGNIRTDTDNTYMGADGGGTPRAGFVKQAGGGPFYGIGNSESFKLKFNNSNNNIDPSGSYTQVFEVQSNGQVNVSNKITGLANGTASTDAAAFGQIPTLKRTTRFIVAPYGDTRPADYTCASATGNEVEINQAIVAANALTNGAVVDLLDGTFTVSHPILPLNNVWLRGQGMFNTKITSIASYTNHLIDNYTVHSPASPWKNAIISDLELDGSNMSNSVASKGINSTALVNCKFIRIYCHDTTATGLGADDYQSVTITECIVNNCGYTNKRTVSAISWSSNTLTVTTSAAHGYSIGSVILLTGFVPIPFNGRYVVTTVIDTTNFTIGTSNNSNTNNLTINPGTATTLGNTSDSLIGHNGIGIASGSLPAEAMIITNNYCSGNNNNNFLAEADTTGTGSNASYIFTNNISVSAGQNGFLSTGTPNVQFNNNYDYGSQYSFQVNQTSASRTITAASWSAGVATYTINTAYTYTLGQKIAITGMTPSGYNGYFTIVSQPTSTTFTVAITSDPGTATVFGTGQVVTHPTDGCQIINNVSINAGLYGVRLPSLSDGVQVDGNVIEGCYNYGIQANSSNSSISNNRIYSCGRDGIYIVTGSGDIAPMHHVRVENNHVYNNGQRVSTAPGIELQSTSSAPVNDVKISGNLSYDNQDTATQYYGIIVRSSGTLSNVDITNNDFSGNASGTLLIQYTGNGVLASNNLGANPIGKSELGTVTGTVSIDRKLASFYTMTLGGNISASFPSGLVKGSELTVIVTQDSTGSRTVSWSGLISWGNGGAPTLSTTAAAADRFTFRWDGTNWLETARVLGYAASPTGTAGGDLTGTYPNPTLAAAGTAGTYAYPTSVTTDSKGRVTSVTANTSTGSGSSVLQTSPTITTPSVAQFNDANGNPWLKVNSTASAIGGFAITNNVSGSSVTFANANTGNSATIIQGAGTGLMTIQPATNSTNAFRFRSSGGTNTHMSYDSSNGRFGFGSGTAPSDVVEVTGNVSLLTAGNKLKIATGTNASAGTGTLSGGTVTISTTAVTANSLIFLTDTTSSLTNVGVMSVTSKSAGTSFTVTSTNVLDVSTFNWLIIN